MRLHTRFPPIMVRLKFKCYGFSDDGNGLFVMTGRGRLSLPFFELSGCTRGFHGLVLFSAITCTIALQNNFALQCNQLMHISIFIHRSLLFLYNFSVSPDSRSRCRKYSNPTYHIVACHTLHTYKHARDAVDLSWTIVSLVFLSLFWNHVSFSFCRVVVHHSPQLYPSRSITTPPKRRLL
jgi:hypothetical protein